MPLSPGFASPELAELLAEAAALEQRLEKGELPGEALRRRSMRAPPPSANASSSSTSASPPPVPQMPHAHAPGQGHPAGTALRPQRASSFRNPLNPLTRSRSDRRAKATRDAAEGRSPASSSMGNLLAVQDAVNADAGNSHSEPGTGQTRSIPAPLVRSMSSSHQLLATVPASPAASAMSEVPPTPPPKSPNAGTRYFSSLSSLRRLASASRGLAGERGSVSTGSEMSSEDSMGLPTPPDDHGLVHHASTSPRGSPQSSPQPPHASIAWPSLASKKSVGSLGRGAASLAGKMWHRSRSKSSASTVSSRSEASSPPPALPVPALPAPPVLKLDSTPFVIPPITTSYDLDHDPSDSPTSSTPIADPFSSLSTVVPASASMPALKHTKSTPQRPPASAPASMLPVPKTAPESRPASWQSVSSTGSSSLATSPLFDKAIFDAFPSVPDMPPQPMPRPLPSLGLARANSLHSNGSHGGGSPVRPLPMPGYPNSPPGYSSSDTSSIMSTPTMSVSDRSFAPSTGSYGRDQGLLTQRR
ncbi:hypothetical protein B0H13DRAFT_2069234 [Mycena leptocephala]|nr:hypothetical protein B0H13DRAFT_2069234 [Mycena leptocephala]